MLDAGDALRTWALPQRPDAAGVQPAEQLADHRREYLDYEGPVSGNRGTVRRWDTGTFRALPTDDDSGAIVFALEGGQLRGLAVLTPIAAGWTFEFRPSSTL